MSGTGKKRETNHIPLHKATYCRFSHSVILSVMVPGLAKGRKYVPGGNLAGYLLSDMQNRNSNASQQFSTFIIIRWFYFG